MHSLNALILPYQITTNINLIFYIMKLSQAQFDNLENYIFDCIDFSDYGFLSTDKKELIAKLLETFTSEYWHENNKVYYQYDIKKAFASWLSGLPSCFNVDFENYRILELGKLWKFDLSTENKEDKFIENWFSMVTNSVFYLSRNKKYKQVRAEQKPL